MIKNQYGERLDKCIHLMNEAGLDALLLTKPTNRKWFARSNTVYEKFEGFISGQLLETTKEELCRYRRTRK